MLSQETVEKVKSFGSYSDFCNECACDDCVLNECDNSSNCDCEHLFWSVKLGLTNSISFEKYIELQTRLTSDYFGQTVENAASKAKIQVDAVLKLNKCSVAILEEKSIAEKTEEEV